MLSNKPKVQPYHKEAMAKIYDSTAQKAPKNKNEDMTRLNQISRTNTKAAAGEKLTITIERPKRAKASKYRQQKLCEVVGCAR